MKKSNKLFGNICIAVLIIGFIYALYVGYQFQHHYSFSVGTVTRITGPGYKGSGNYSIVFRYTVNGKEYTGNNDRNYCGDQTGKAISALLLGKSFPVVYGIKNPSVGYMLLTQDYANKFKYTLPDSVRSYDSVLSCK